MSDISTIEQRIAEKKVEITEIRDIMAKQLNRMVEGDNDSVVRESHSHYHFSLMKRLEELETLQLHLAIYREDAGN